MTDVGDMTPSKMQQIPLDMPFPKLQGHDDFIISDCNRLAAAWINRWPDWPKPGHSLNLVGPPGSGKSHLAAIWQNMCGACLCDHPAALATMEMATAPNAAAGVRNECLAAAPWWQV